MKVCTKKNVYILNAHKVRKVDREQQNYRLKKAAKNAINVAINELWHFTSEPFSKNQENNQHK